MSMPSIGQVPLLTNSYAVVKLCNECVNALNRATLISTGKMSIQNEGNNECVNALNRAILISTKKNNIS